MSTQEADGVAWLSGEPPALRKNGFLEALRAANEGVTHSTGPRGTGASGHQQGIQNVTRRLPASQAGVSTPQFFINVITL